MESWVLEFDGVLHGPFADRRACYFYGQVLAAEDPKHDHSYSARSITPARPMRLEGFLP